MLKKTYIQAVLTPLLWFVCTNIYSNCTITGTVVSLGQNEPLDSALVYIDKHWTYSDKSGHFKLVVPEIKYTDSLRILCLGYTSVIFVGLDTVTDIIKLDTIRLIYSFNVNFSQKKVRYFKGKLKYKFKDKLYKPEYIYNRIWLFDLFYEKKEKHAL